MSWKQITSYLETAAWVTKVAAWTKVPQLVLLNKIVKILEIMLDITKRQLLKINQDHADVVIQRTEQSGTVIEAERQKPVSEQNNDVLRDQARARYDERHR